MCEVVILASDQSILSLPVSPRNESIPQSIPRFTVGRFYAGQLSQVICFTKEWFALHQIPAGILLYIIIFLCLGLTVTGIMIKKDRNEKKDVGMAYQEVCKHGTMHESKGQYITKAPFLHYFHTTVSMLES